MKKHLLTLLFFIGSWFYGSAQWVSIPDTNFGTWLNTNGYSQCLQGNNVVGWEMDTTCGAVVNATGITCENKNIADLTGLEYFDNLDTLDCAANSLILLPTLPIKLSVLFCTNNSLTSLPALPDSLHSLTCAGNLLGSLPDLPSALNFLICNFNYNLTWLPTLPNSITKIYCSHCQLTYLPILPNSLVELDCNYNLLSTLPHLPNSLTSCICYANRITTLPVLPNSLTWLLCGWNLLTTLPVIPNSIIKLDCPYNLIASLPTLPNTLLYLECNHNQLTSLPVLPDSLVNFDCYDNPNLHCLPQLKKIRTFSFYNTGVMCLPNYPQSNTSSNPPFTDYPLCDTSSFNIYGCGAYWNISGTMYKDTSLNCVYDAGEQTIRNLKVQLYNNNILQQQASTSADGFYIFDTDLSNFQYSIDTINLPLTVSCPDSGYYTSVIIAADSFDGGKNFGLRCKLGFDLVAESVTGRLVPGSTRQLDISAGDNTNFYGQHCAAGTSGSVQVIINGAAHYVSAATGALIPSNVSSDTVVWNIPDFGTVNFFSDFNIMLQTDTNAQLGSLVCFSLVVNPIIGDNNPSNNVLDYCGVVVAGFDPNEKEVYPVGNIDASQEWLTYTIHFQNTGTAEAQHIYVTDTLDSNVDAASFQLLAYSHQPMVQIKENAVRFNFPNINLPDSNTNEPLSHGYVQYKVKLKNNLPLGTTINNTAFIYFDFNAPVVTNTTTNTITTSTSIKAVSQEPLAFRIYPNPANSAVTISIDESMIGSNLTVYDITGRKMSAVQLETRNLKLETSRLANGIYFVNVENERGRVTKKLVIEK